jgi:hypothetical protein
MRSIKILGFVCLILFGVFMFVYGGMDDSPGGQLMGVVAAIIGIVGVVKIR